MKKRKKCKCNIQGYVQIWKRDGDLLYVCHPEEATRYYRDFKYCPLCGVKFIEADKVKK